MKKKLLHRIWFEMKNRCDKVDHPTYSSYGGKGITYQESWKDFEAFSTDMDTEYQRNVVLSRYDTECDYTKENCYWTDILDSTIDVMNYRMPVSVPIVVPKQVKNYYYKGEVNSIEGFARKYGIRFVTVSKKVARGWSIDRALEEAIRESEEKRES